VSNERATTYVDQATAFRFVGPPTVGRVRLAQGGDILGQAVKDSQAILTDELLANSKNEAVLA